MNINEATIMVVDDEPELVEIFSIWLKRKGGRVLTASNGAEALKLLTEYSVHALVSDIRMPVMDGVTLVESIHKQQLDVPTIIFVSGFADIASRALYAMGVVAMIAKPLRRDQLVNTLEASLRAREELWLTAPVVPAELDLAAEFSSLEDATACGDFGLGNGGCCFRSPKAMPECTVDLHLRFATDVLALDGRGIVRWYDPRTQHVGVEFAFLEPGARRWVLQQMVHKPTRSFIPSCGLPT